MSHSQASTSELHDFALAGPDLAAAACGATLTRLRELMTAPPAAAAVTEMSHLTSFARRIAGALDLAAEAVIEGDNAAAALEHGRALALINALRLITAAEGRPAPAPEPAQKSGSTG